jgi:hypothetical protein
MPRRPPGTVPSQHGLRSGIELTHLQADRDLPLHRITGNMVGDPVVYPEGRSEQQHYIRIRPA